MRASDRLGAFVSGVCAIFLPPATLLAVVALGVDDRPGEAVLIGFVGAICSLIAMGMHLVVDDVESRDGE